MKILLSVAVLLLILRLASAQTVTYQGATLQPGDVINLLEGPATTGHFQTYGHSALFLGVDPQTKQPTFMDFTVTKNSEGKMGSAGEIVQGVARPFRGRILTEKEFLAANAGHGGFDVFRMKDATLDQKVLLREAKNISMTGSWGSSDVCSSAVASVLSKASGTTVDVKTPTGFVGGAFERHPQLLGKSININAALRETQKTASNPLVGTWSGTVEQAGGGGSPSYGVVMRLDGNGGGSTEYASLKCGGSLSRISETGGSYSYRETVSHGRVTADTTGCIDGTITMRLVGDDTMSWSWQGSFQGEAISASATLKKGN